MLASINTSNTTYLTPVFLSLGSTVFPILIGYVSKRMLLTTNTEDADKSSMELSEKFFDGDDSDANDTEIKPLV